ncbi:hypothetical protein BB558_002839 [Smittium angustum]|uniref:Uncharacterized protein n=1 Tax=Smittium angustum TaxID=133377 RepID=A0A2U1J7S5_SMIAN|nr:hypothetical protein BB558_002839 [Smittium angustum]
MDIYELISTFETTAAKSQTTHKDSVEVVFRIYRKNKSRDYIKRIIVKNFKSYMSFGMGDGIMDDSISTLSPNDYFLLKIKLHVRVDDRLTKMSIPQIPVFTKGPIELMGPNSQSTMDTKINMIHNIFGSSQTSFT